MTAQMILRRGRSSGRETRYKRASLPNETAQYITDMALELRNLARKAELKTLSGLLEIAYYEAFSQASKVEIPAVEVERLKALEAAAKNVA